MLRLVSRHPARLALGFAIMARDSATRLRLTTIVIFCDRAIKWARTAADVSGEIVVDAGCGETLVDEVARDGQITATEAEQLRRQFAEIQTEAREGRII